jgi:hypothetical protein
MPCTCEPLLIGFGEHPDIKSVEERLKRITVEGVEVSPWNFAVADSIHQWLILLAPGVRKGCPVDIDVSLCPEFLAVTDPTTSSVHDCSKNIEDERVDVWWWHQTSLLTRLV